MRPIKPPRVSGIMGMRCKRLERSIDGGNAKTKEEKEAAREKAKAGREMARAKEESEP